MKQETQEPLPAWARYGLSLLAVAAATCLRLALDPWLGQSAVPYVTFNAAVALAAFLWGRGPGIAATIVGGLACDIFIIPPRYAIPFTSAAERVPMVFFMATGLVVSILAGRLHASRQLADERAQSLRQRAEELQRNREWLRVTLNSIGDAVIASDDAGRVTFLNPVAASLTGWPVEQAVGQPIASVFKLIDEQTRQPGEDLVSRVLSERRIVAMANHTALIARDGRETPIEDSAAPITDPAGQVSGVVLVFHDVAEKRRAQNAIRASEQQFRTLADAIPQLAWTAQADGFIHWYNRRWYEYTGTTPQQMEGWGWQSVHDPHALPRVLERWKTSIATGEPFNMVFPLRGADGLFRPFLTRVQPLKDAQGRVLQWFGTNTDVEELKRMEEAQTLLAAIVESSDDAIVSKDLNGTILSWNAGAQRLFGYGAQEIIGQPITLLLPPELAQEEEQIFARLLRGEPSEHVETIRVAKDGRRIEVWVTVSPLKDREGQVVGASTIVHDITERKAVEHALRLSEEKFAKAFAGNPAAIALTRLEDGQFLDVNDTWLALNGYRREEVLGLSSKALPIWPTPQARTRFVQALLEKGSLQGWEQEFLKSSGEAFVAQLSAQILSVRGEAVLLSTLVDITTRKRAEEALAAAKLSAEQAKAVAEAASKAKDHFLAVLSHELRNPLNPVLATATMLRKDPRFDADTREQLEVICRNAELEARLIDDLLDVTRIERGKVDLDRRPIELCTIIRRAVEVCRPDIEARKLEFGVDLGPAPYWVDADAARLQQVFWNLLKNAVKFTPLGGCVGIRCRRDEDAFVIAEVIDSGEGIEREALARIFNAFEQAERSITRQFGGLGLGLAISKGLVEMHGGSIQASSEGKGRGATFTVRLPLLATHAAAGAIPPASDSPPPRPATRPLRILLVEDHGDTARIMSRLLSADGHEVQSAADVATALKLAEKQGFDLLLSDLGLPDGSGFDLMRALRAKGISLPGIALSGYGQENDIQQSRQVGFIAHLIKPVSLPRLEEAIAKVVGDSPSTV